MKKEDLTALGLSEEQAEKVLSMHNSSIDGSFIPKSRFNEVNEENKTLKQTISDRDKQLETLKKSSGDNAELKKQIETLQQQNADQKKAHDAELLQLKLDNAVEKALTSAGAKNITAVRSLLDSQKFKLDDDGSVSGLKEQLEAVQKSDPYMFHDTTVSFKGFQPGQSGDIKPAAEVDTSKMTYSEMMTYLEANPDAAI